MLRVPGGLCSTSAADALGPGRSVVGHWLPADLPGLIASTEHGQHANLPQMIQLLHNYYGILAYAY